MNFIRKTSLISFLYALGLSLSVLSIFGLHGVMLLATLLLALLHGALFAYQYNKIGKIAVGVGLLVLGVGIFISGAFFNFISSLSQMASAFALLLQGANNIFLAFGKPFAVVVALICFAVAKMFTEESLGFMPMLLLLIAMLYFVIQISGTFQVMYSLPAWLALLLVNLDKKRQTSLKAYLVMGGIIALTFIFLPFSMHAIKPLSELAKTVRERLQDYLFFTEKREVFSLEDYGYYPFGIERFGGRVELSNNPVMSVTTPKKMLLKGITKDYYNGSAFLNIKKTGRYLYINPRWHALRVKSLLEKYPLKLPREGILEPQDTEVKILSNIHTTLLVPDFVRKIQTQKDMILYFNETGELFITRNLKPGDGYTFSAPIVEGGEVGLNALVDYAAKNDDPLLPQMASHYLQMPTHIESAVHNLKDKIIKDAKTPYEQAVAIMNFLKTNYRYSLDVKEPPKNVDFVTNFLFNTREGYCTYFAASFTVLARLAGLPARFVEGFLATPDADGIARVTTRNAHAWSEVYFKGFGWVPFDPTPTTNNGNNPPPPNNNNTDPTPTPTPNPSNPTPTPTPPQSGEATPPPEQNDEEPPTPPTPPPNQNGGDHSAWLWWLLLLFTLFTLSVYGYFAHPLQRVKRMASQRERTALLAKCILALLKGWDKDMKPYTGTKPFTLYAKSIARHLPVNPLPFADALNHLSYTQMENLDWDEEVCLQTYHMLFSALPRHKKAYFNVLFSLRAFGKL